MIVLTVHQVILLKLSYLWTKDGDALIHYFLPLKEAKDLLLTTVTNLFELFFLLLKSKTASTITCPEKKCDLLC